MYLGGQPSEWLFWHIPKYKAFSASRSCCFSCQIILITIQAKMLNMSASWESHLPLFSKIIIIIKKASFAILKALSLRGCSNLILGLNLFFSAYQKTCEQALKFQFVCVCAATLSSQKDDTSFYTSMPMTHQKQLPVERSKGSWNNPKVGLCSRKILPYQKIYQGQREVFNN